MKTQFVGALLAVWANIALTQAFYGPRDDVTELTPHNFGPAILDTDQLVAVEFYAPWCGHCQRLAPEWKKVAANLKGLVNVGAVDCDVETNKGLCAMYEIKGFPTIKVFSPELKKDKRTGQMTKVPTDYQGPRDAKSMVDYFLSSQPSNVQFIKWNEKDVKSKKSITLDNFLQTKNETLPKALLFTNKPTTTPLYKALSVDFKDRMLTGEVKQSERNIVSEYGIESFPTLLIVSPEHGTVKFEGKLNRENLKSFMEKYALPSDKKSPPPPPQKKAADLPKKKVKQVIAYDTDKVLEEQCLKLTGNSVCVIAITGDEDKQDTLHTLNALKDKVSPSQQNLEFEYGWIHADRSKDIINTLQLSEDYPSIFIVHPSKLLFRNYIGSWSEENLVKWLNQIGSGRVQAWSYKGSLKLNEAPSHQDNVEDTHYEDVETPSEPVRDEL
ncbi:thioredoxin domain containing protein [Mucor ambiguus]|uniref:protein disulfide-isomerase n=1 Tax=Mucor ambiguus TaxID=91626 RepID=A0A0C9MG31_9FUNG|nr:thioredoxin domain containing protein [Mucor ambiguus]